MRQQWPKLGYLFLYYHDENKLMMNKKKYCQSKCSKLSQTVPWLQHGYMCTSWGQVTWLFLLGHTCSNHCDVTVRFVTLNANNALNQNIDYHSWETDQNYSKCVDKMLFWKYKLFTMVKLPHSEHKSVLLDTCQHYIDLRLFSEEFLRLGLNLTI